MFEVDSSSFAKKVEDKLFCASHSLQKMLLKAFM